MTEGELTWQEAIVGLYLVNDFMRATNGGSTPAPGWFHRHGVLTGLSNTTTRRCALRLARLEICIACASAVSPDSEGDHIIPVSRGGPAGVENYIPMCRSCNSSKGNRDLFDWWASKQHPFTAMPPDVVTAYCRLVLPRLSYERVLNKPASSAMVMALVQFASELPSRDHKRALWDRIRWVVGW